MIKNHLGVELGVQGGVEGSMLLNLMHASTVLNMKNILSLQPETSQRL